MTTVLFFYGLAFILMGIAIFVVPRRNDILGLSDGLWPLGLFAILHGLNEWLDMLIVMKSPFDPAQMMFLGDVLLPCSFIFLVVFSGRALYRLYPRFALLKYLWAICFLAWMTVYAYFGDAALSGIASRYFICLPGAILSAITFRRYLLKTGVKNLPKSYVSSIYAVICSFALYGIVAGLVVPRADFIPANIINYSNFIRVFGVPVQLLRMILAIIITGGFFIVCGQFFHDNNKKMRMSGGIGRKIGTLIGLVTIIIVSIGIVSGYYAGITMLKDVIGSNLVTAANIIAKGVVEKIDGGKIYAEAIAADPIIVSAVRESNARYDTMAQAEIDSLMSDMDARWIPAGKDDQLIRDYTENIIGKRLRAAEVCDRDVSEIFVSDKNGALVAASGKTSDFYQADELWWQKAYACGKGKAYIGDVGWDESSHVWSITFAAPIRDADGTAIGVVKSIANIGEFFHHMSNVNIGRTGRIALINKNGAIIFRQKGEYLSKEMMEGGPLRKILSSTDSGYIVTDAIAIGQGKVLRSFVAVDSPLFFDSGILWKVVISQNAEEAFAPLRRLIYHAIILSALLIVLIIVLSYYFGIILAAPIKDLESAADKLRRGEFDMDNSIKTGDEIEDLADTFKSMAAAINEREYKLAISKSYVDSVISSITDALIVTDKEYKISLVNKAALDLLGYPEDEIIGKPMQYIFSHDDETASAQYLAEIMEKMITRNVGLALAAKDGTRIPINLSGAVIFKDKDMMGTVNLAKDMRQIMSVIDELKLSKEDLEKAYLKLKEAQATMIQSEKESALGRFSLGISHEVKNPLAIIVGASDYLEMKLSDGTLDVKDNLHRIKDAALRANAILEGILQYMRPAPLTLESASVNLLVREAIPLLKLQPSLSKIDIAAELSPENILVSADRNQILQVIFNVVKNSIEACGEGCTVAVNTDRVQYQAIISVVDNGSGMAKETLFRIFEPFFSTKRPGKGTGLGLVIARTIVENHHGSIVVDSEEGKGTTVKIILPIVKGGTG